MVGVAGREHDRSTLRKGLARSGPQDAGERGFTALKAEPLAKAMGVSRGSFYWHFADIGAFHAAILKHWREVAAEQIIANLEAASGRQSAAAAAAPGVRQQAGAGERGPHLGHVDPAARAAVQAIDRRRLGYVESL
jgi:AcrR family transcriptional regulator